MKLVLRVSEDKTITVCVLALVMVLLICSLSVIGSVYAQSVSKPSVPEFTLTLIDDSYDIPTTTSINPYNGSAITRPGSHIKNMTIELSIKNQHYDSTYAFFYTIKMKGHFEDQWNVLMYPYSEQIPDSFTSDVWAIGGRPLSASNSEFTAKSFSANGYPTGTQLDFSVKALVYSVTPPPAGSKYQPTVYTLVGESDWSNTQTLTLSAASTVAVTPVPSVSPSQDMPSADNQGANSASDLGWLQVATVALLAVIAVLLAFAVFYLRKKSSSNPPIRAT